jgi:hypothetical protein
LASGKSKPNGVAALNSASQIEKSKEKDLISA